MVVCILSVNEQNLKLAYLIQIIKQMVSFMSVRCQQWPVYQKWYFPIYLLDILGYLGAV